MSAITNQMTLDSSDLNPTDVAILDELRHGRATPAHIAEKHGYSSGNVRNRMTHLTSHDHVERIGGGMYELVDDPRDDIDDRVRVLLVRTSGPTTLEEAENAIGLELGPAAEDVESDIVKVSKDDLKKFIHDE